MSDGRKALKGNHGNAGTCALLAYVDLAYKSVIREHSTIE